MSPSRASQPPSPSSISRPASVNSQRNQHAPINPSHLREAHLATSPDNNERLSDPTPSNQFHAPEQSIPSNPAATSLRNAAAQVPANPSASDSRGGFRESLDEVVSETTSLLCKPFEGAHDGPADGPKAVSRTNSYLSTLADAFTGRGGSASSPNNENGDAASARSTGSAGSKSTSGGIWSKVTGRGGGGAKPPFERQMSRTQTLAREHGIKNTNRLYLSYYIPFFAWIGQYRWAFLKGDLIAALTMASFYLPMSLSYASNLGHIPPINGLYSFIFNPLIYAFMGSCPRMIVGPEAPGSLLLGTVVRDSIESGKSGDENDELNARVAGVVTGIAGAIIFIAGLTRLGFLDSVLSKPFLRGFISAVGFVIFVDQLIPELGLTELAAGKGGVSHGSSVDKIIFMVENRSHVHRLTFTVAATAFVITMTLRTLKRKLQPRYPSVAYFPDRFLVVLFSIILTYAFRWDKQGLEIMGEIKSPSGNPFQFHWPFQWNHMKHVRSAMSTSFVIALLGFFESSVAAKSLGGGEGKAGDGIQGVQLSANRELVALGVANIVGGCFCALPAFGGYGRSKVNASTGGKTPMSSVFLSLITVCCVLFLLPYFHYLPKAVLSSMISVVAWSLIEECPEDILFFIRIRGISELSLMLIIFCATIFYSLTLGIALGIGLSLLAVIRHSTRPRIQILGRIPGTSRFENAEAHPENLEYIEGCLIVKIPEPLTFANTGDLKARLRRLELYGRGGVHPALPRLRREEDRNVVFDVHGVTWLDGSGAQVLAEIVEQYGERGVRVFFARCPREGSEVWKLMERAGIVEGVGGKGHFVRDVDEALRLMEGEEVGGGGRSPVVGGRGE